MMTAMNRFDLKEINHQVGKAELNSGHYLQSLIMLSRLHFRISPVV
jgi:hypothetical protein